MAGVFLDAPRGSLTFPPWVWGAAAVSEMHFTWKVKNVLFVFFVIRLKVGGKMNRS